MNSNRVVPIPQEGALGVTTYINDTTGPQVVGFDLDMDQGILSIYFLETVNVRSVNFSCLTVQSDALGLGRYQLTGGTLLMPYSPDELSNSGSGLGASEGSGMGVSASGSGSGSGDLMISANDTNIFTPIVGSGENFDRFVVLTDEVASRDTTAIFVNFTLADLNAIKMLQLATRSGNTFLRADSCAISDQSDLPLIPVFPGRSVRFYTPDTTSPELQEFDLDMDNGRLTMRFSETVAGRTLDAAQITLQAREVHDTSNSDLAHSLVLNTYVPGFDNTPGLSTEIVLTIKILDLNRIKQLTDLATSMVDTYISITSLTIEDTVGNDISPIPQTSALQVTSYTRDMTSPELLGFTLDLDSDVLILTFDETVSGRSLDETRVILQEYQFNTPGDSSFSLQGSPHDLNESTIISVYLSFEDRNEIKRIEDLSTRDRNTWIVFDELLINDTSMNRVVPVENEPSLDNPARVFVPDMTKPELLAYSLNLTSETLSLSFSETVNADTFDVTQILFQSEPGDVNVTTYRLTTSSTLQNGDSAFFDIQLSTQDLNVIKRRRELAMGANNTFISFRSSLVEDMNGNSIVAVNSSDPQPASEFFEDVTRPELMYFDLDLTSELLTLFFSETVDPYLLDLAGIVLQQAENVDPDGIGNDDARYVLTGGIIVIPSLFDSVLVINLSDVDLNNIKRLFDLATSRDDTFISFRSSLIMDINSNDVIPSSPFSAQQVRVYMRDATPPIVNEFSLDIDTGLLRFVFSETVNIDTFDLSMIYIQSSPTDPAESVQLLASEVSTANDTIVEVRLSRLDLDNLKRNVFVATSNFSTNLVVPEPTLMDMAGNLLVPIPPRSALGVGEFQADSQAPVFEALDVDLNSGIFTLYFDEAVNLDTLNLTAITFQVSRNISDLDPDFELLTLEGGTVLESRNEATVSVSFTIDDLNAVKMRAVCRSPETCYISFPSGTVYDIAQFPVAENPAFQVTNFTFDTTPPTLVRFVNLDLNNGTIVLEFDESVNVDSFDFSGIVLQSFFREPQASLSLTGGVIDSENGTIVTIQLLPEDFLRIKEDERVCSNSNNCWMRLLTGALADMNENIIQEILDGDALDAGRVQEDDIRPNLLSYELNIEDGILTLNFDEPVRPSTLDPRGISIQPAADASEFVQLSTESSTDSVNGAEVVIVLDQSDLDRIKATDFAKSENDTFLRLEAFAIRDVAVRSNNYVVPLPNGRAQQVARYVADTTRPYLVSFSLNLISEVVTLTFNEPVLPSTLDVTEIALLSTPDDRNVSLIMVVHVPLTSGSVAGEDAVDGTFSFSITLNREAIEVLKLDDFIATSEMDTFLSVNAPALTDTAGNYIQPIAPINATQASQVTQDDTSTPATLDTYTLDLNLGELALTFTDIVNPGSLRPGAITIQNSALAEVGVTLTGASTTSSPNGYVVVVDIGTPDLNRVKYNTSLATNINNTFITLGADVVRDLQGSDIIPVTDGNGVGPVSYTPDMTGPVLEAFRLNLNSGELTLSFSETVNTQTLDVSGITLQSGSTRDFSDVSSVRLTALPLYPIGSRSVSDNGASIVVNLGSEDLNEIKRLADLGTAITNTLISIENGSISDMVDIGNEATSPSLPIMVIDITPDTTEPELVGFSLDLNEGVLYLTLSETVNSSTLNVNGITIQNSSDTFLDRVTLGGSRGSETQSPDGVVIAVDIGRDDLNDIKRNRQLGTAISNTYLFLQDFVIQDTSMNFNLPIYNPLAQGVGMVTNDTTNPFLLSFDLDLDRSELILTFDETVETSSLMVGEIVLQSAREDLEMMPDIFGSGSASNASGSRSGSGSGSGFMDEPLIVMWRLNPGSVPLYSQTFSSDDPIVVISLGEIDFNEITRLTELATTRSNTYITYTSSTVQDMSENSVTEITSSDAAQVRELIRDENPPVLRRYNLDMDSGRIYFTFSETVNASSLDPSRIVVLENQSPSSAYQLSSGSVLSENSTVIVVQMLTVDLNFIKNDSNLLTSQDNTFVRFLFDGVQDMSGNSIVEIRESDALQVSNFTEDTTAPQLLTFDLNLSTDELILTFDETVDTSSLDVRGILVQQYEDSIGDEFYRIQPPSQTVDPDSTVLTVRLSRVDTNEIKRMTMLAFDANSTYISLSNFTILDTNGNSVSQVPISSAVQVRVYIRDVVRPMLEDFHLDLDANQLVLTFDETIDIDYMPMYAGITLHNGDTLNSSSRQQRFSPSGATILNTDHSHIVVIRFLLEDINNIKLYTDFGTDVNNTYLTIEDDTVRDLSYPLPNGLVGTTLQANTIIPDQVSPNLVMFRVDLNAGRLFLFFNEPVNTSSLMIDGLTVQNARRSRTGVMLATATHRLGTEKSSP